MNEVTGCRGMELLCRHRAAFDPLRSWKWLGKAERWKQLSDRETAARFAQHPGPMDVGPDKTKNERQLMRTAQRAHQRSLWIKRVPTRTDYPATASGIRQPNYDWAA